MENEFVPYEEALALKELGFDEPVIATYQIGYEKDLYPTKYWSKDNRNSMWIDGIISAPTYSHAFRWFRKEYGLYSSIIPKKSWPDNYITGIEWYVNICGGNGKEIGPEGVFTYEEAEQACLDKLIKIVKNE